MKGSSAFLPIGEFQARQRTTSITHYEDNTGPTEASTPSRKRPHDGSEDDSHDSMASCSSSTICTDIPPSLDVFRSSCRAPMDHRTILETLISKEQRQMPDPHYMTTIQHQLKPRMTSILCEWLVDVCSEDCLGFSRNTLDTAIRNVERYLSKYEVHSSQFQLLGAASLLIAYKLNERHQDKIVDLLVDFGGDAYTKPQLFAMERIIAIALEWNLVPVIAHEILEIMVDAEHKEIARLRTIPEDHFVKRRRVDLPASNVKTDEHTWCMMQDVLYVSESNYTFLHHPPSVQAAGAYCFAKRNQMGTQEAFLEALAFCKDLLNITESHVINFVKMLETSSAEDATDKTRSATPQSVAGGDVFAD